MKNHPVIPVGRRWAFAVASAGGAIALAAAMVPATSAVAASEAASVTHISGSATYHGKMEHAKRLGLVAHIQNLHAVTSHAVTHAAALQSGHNRVFPFRSPNGPDPAGKGGLQAPNATSGALAGRVTANASGPSIIHAFNGLSDLDQTNLPGNGFEVTPPDQGLCVGFAHFLPGSPKVVWEVINSAAVAYTVGGKALIGPISLGELYNDPFNLGDPRCLYDPKTASFYFTEIGFPPGGPSSTGNNTTVDVTVVTAKGDVGFYQFDTSLAGGCFGDQPKTGFDNNALIVSTDEYCGPAENIYEGAIVVAISKSQLNHLALTVNNVVLGPVSLGGIPVVGLDPAINTTTGTSYFVNSFPFTAAGDNNSVSNALGLWTLKGDSAVTSGTGTITLAGKVINSEHYAFPVLADSTGSGTADSNGITSEAVLNPDDSRLSAPVTVTKADDGAVQLWTALDSAVTVGTSPAAVDGAAWFKINTATQKVASQGYVAQKGANLLYPAVQAPASGPAAMVFTITSPTINPSAAYTSLGSGKVTIIGKGAGPHVSFCEVSFPASCPFGRWGDYSFVATDPGTNGIWLATEYIPPASSQDPADNWGTFVFKLSN